MEEKKYLTLPNIYNRLIAEGPTFFKKLRRFMFFCATLGAGLAGARSLYSEQLAFIPVQIDGYLIAIGLVGAAVSSLTVNDPNNNPKVD